MNRFWKRWSPLRESTRPVELWSTLPRWSLILRPLCRLVCCWSFHYSVQWVVLTDHFRLFAICQNKIKVFGKPSSHLWTPYKMPAAPVKLWGLKMQAKNSEVETGTKLGFGDRKGPILVWYDIIVNLVFSAAIPADIEQHICREQQHNHLPRPHRRHVSGVCLQCIALLSPGSLCYL